MDDEDADPGKANLVALASPATFQDVRLRRAQALALDTPLQMELVRHILDIKLKGQLRVATDILEPVGQGG